jgi:predicted transcriptional regulator
MAATGDIIISVKPEHARNIIVGRKTVELRRRFADTSAIGRWMLIYSSSPEKALIGAVRIANVRRMAVGTLWRAFREQACVPRSAFIDYFSGVTEGVGVILGPVVRFDPAISASELRERFSFCPPQSYRYVRGPLTDLLDDERIQIPDRHQRGDWSRGQLTSRCEAY